ncbi:glycosyltransferase family 4 protein [Pseudomonas luteola]|uniref:MraY family glycosyltransferase n=1 Tax=Pseudomonas luteola TaxID=47886 RepID=UPI00388D7C5C
MNLLWLLPIISGVSWLLTGTLRRYALVRSIIDIPNERSSHTVPTPRGGGVAIVIVSLLSVTVLWLFSIIHTPLAVSLLGAGAGLALLGFLDDHEHIAARWRLLGHFAGASWVLFWLGGMPPFTVLGWKFDLGGFGYIIGAFYLVWLLNLYNFMDGIDGIASVEAICVCAGGALLVLVSQGAASTAWVVPIILAAAVSGFLLWNFPPAKIFMGDAGSGFLGIMLGALSLEAGWLEAQWLWSWLILLGVFFVDATYTLFRRLLRSEKVYQAHRSHAYQYASRHYRSHFVVTLAVFLINIFWLIPNALVVGLGYIDGVLGLVLAYIPLVVLATKFRAGELEYKAK